MKKHLVLVAVSALSLSLGACATHLPPDASPEAKLAVRGSQVVAALRATLPQIKTLTCVGDTSERPSTCVKAADAIKVVEVISKAADVAKDLAAALEAVDNATSSTVSSRRDRAKRLLADIQTMLTQSAAIPVDASARTALAGIFSSVTAVLFSVF